MGIPIDEVTVACVNFSPAWDDKDANLAKITVFVEKAVDSGANIVLFPETALWKTTEVPPLDIPRMKSYKPMPAGTADIDPSKIPGFSESLERHRALAEPIPGPAVKHLEELAKKHDIYIAMGMIENHESEADLFYNSVPLIGPEGLVGVHRKIMVNVRPGTPEYAPGERYEVFETKYGKIGIVICADMWVAPESLRLLAMKGSRLILNASCFAFQSRGQLEGLYDILRFSCGSNGPYIAFANTVPGTGATGKPFEGQSMIVGVPASSLWAQVIAGPASGYEEELVCATIDLTTGDQQREWLMAWRQNHIKGALSELYK
jgi:predicted amidohydrolase